MEKEIKTKVKKQIAEMVASGLPESVGEIIIREGKAVELREPAKVVINGTIDAPARWLEKRFDRITEKTCNVVVNREKLQITLQCNENNYYGSLVAGRLELSPEYCRFGINSGVYMTNFEMAELIKMNRTFFENRQTSMELVTELQNFKAKVDKEIENSNNNRGDRRILVNQVVKSNLPKAFTLIIPIFKGTSPEAVEVEVYVYPGDLTCTLVSAEAADIVEKLRNEEIDDVIKRIEERCPDIVIIEQ